MTRNLRFLSVAAVVATLAAAPAAAQPLDEETTARAQVHFEAGTQAFDTGDYERAVAEFRQAYELTEHPDLLFNVYSSAERAGHLEEAERALSSYLERAELEPGRRPILVQRLARLRDRIAAQEPTEEPGAPSEEAPEPDEPAAVAPPAAPPTATEDAPSRGGGVHPAGPALLITAGVLLASFGVFAALSEVEDESLAGSCGRDGPRVCTSAQIATVEAYNVVADVSWIAGAVAGVTGLVLLFTLPPDGDDGGVAAAPWVAPGAGGVVAAGRF